MDDQNSSIQLIISLGEAAEFLSFDSVTHSFKVDRSKLHLDLVKDYEIKITLIDDEDAKRVYFFKVHVVPDVFGQETEIGDILQVNGVLMRPCMGDYEGASPYEKCLKRFEDPP